MKNKPMKAKEIMRCANCEKALEGSTTTTPSGVRVCGKRCRKTYEAGYRGLLRGRARGIR